MLRVQKGNRQLKINESEKAHYLSLGYDLIDEKGTVKEHATNKSVSISEYEKVKKELEELKSEKKQAPKTEAKAAEKK